MALIPYDLSGVSLLRDDAEPERPPQPLPSEQEVRRRHRELLADPALLRRVRRRWPLGTRTLRTFEVGAALRPDGWWAWIPVRDEAGGLVNVKRRYLGNDPNLNVTGRKYRNWPGHGRPRLYPAHRLPPEGSPLLVLCGEADVMTVWQVAGVPAVTTTGGVDTWPKEGDDLGRQFNVTVMFDRGEEAWASRLAVRLGGQVARLPYELPHGTDLSDLAREWGPKQLRRFVNVSRRWSS